MQNVFGIGEVYFGCLIVCMKPNIKSKVKKKKNQNICSYNQCFQKLKIINKLILYGMKKVISCLSLVNQATWILYLRLAYYVGGKFLNFFVHWCPKP